MTALLQGSPEWVILLALMSSMSVGILAALVRLARAVVPQESKDRLEWWKDRRARRERKKHLKRQREGGHESISREQS
jgi:hypothetical protein